MQQSYLEISPHQLSLQVAKSIFFKNDLRYKYKLSIQSLREEIQLAVRKKNDFKNQDEPIKSAITGKFSFQVSVENKGNGRKICIERPSLKREMTVKNR